MSDGGYVLTADERRQALASAEALRKDLERRLVGAGGVPRATAANADLETARRGPRYPDADTSAARALRRVAAARNFRSAAEAELDEAVLDARRVGCTDQEIAGVLGMTTQGAAYRRRVATERRLAEAPADDE